MYPPLFTIFKAIRYSKVSMGCSTHIMTAAGAFAGALEKAATDGCTEAVFPVGLHSFPAQLLFGSISSPRTLKHNSERNIVQETPFLSVPEF